MLRAATVVVLVLLAAISIASAARLLILEFAVGRANWFMAESERRLGAAGAAGPNWLKDLATRIDPRVPVLFGDRRCWENLMPALARGCLAEVDQALRQTPASPLLWAQRARLLAMIDPDSPDIVTALVAAHRTGGRDDLSRPLRLALGLALMERLPVALRRRLEEDVRQIDTRTVHRLAEALADMPSLRAASRRAFDATASDSMRVVLGRALRPALAERRRRADRRLLADAAGGSDRCPSTDRVAVVATGTAFEGNPRFALWVNGRKIVTDEAVTPGPAALNPRDILVRFGRHFALSQPKPICTVEVEFVNDRWGGRPDRDRNLAVLGVVVGETFFGADCLSAPDLDADIAKRAEGALWLYRSGAVRLNLAVLQKNKP